METGDFFGEIGILNLDGGINRWGTIPSPPKLNTCTGTRTLFRSDLFFIFGLLGFVCFDNSWFFFHLSSIYIHVFYQQKYNGLRYFLKCVLSFLATTFYIKECWFFKRRTADVKSVGYSELFVLSREDVLEALKDHPEAEVKELFYTLK